MPNLVNINAEAGADIIGDDAEPTLTLVNTSTGNALRARSLATTGVSADFNRGTVVSSPTVAVVSLGIGSGVSSPVLELREQAFVSATTILFTTAATAGTGALRVKIGDNYGWIPILKDAAVTAAVRG